MILIFTLDEEISTPVTFIVMASDVPTLNLQNACGQSQRISIDNAGQIADTGELMYFLLYSLL